MNPMLLQHTLRGLCTDSGSQWVYAVFWRILPRNYPPPQWDTEGGVMDRSKGNKRNWILVWEDGFCDFAACGVEPARAAPTSSSFLSTRQLRANDHEPETMNPELFFKMSHEVYNYGEGLMGKVAVDNSHKWVYKEPLENEISFLSPWHASLDPHPRTWEAQFKAGIQTIAVVAVQEGVLQLGSTKRVMEDLSFILYTQRKFNFLHSVPGVASASGSYCGTKRPLPAMFDSHSQLTSMRSVSTPEPWRPMSNITHIPFTGVNRPPDNTKEYAYFDSSPSKVLNTGYTSPQGALLPSAMSSLQALLSKLPSVTDDAESTIHGLGVPFPVSLSMTTPEVKVMDSSSTSEADMVEHPPLHHESGSMFLESLNEYGIPEAQENGDSSYSSFFNEICS